MSHEEIGVYLKEMKIIQDNILEFLDNDENAEENFLNLQSLFNDLKISNEKHKLKSVLYIIAKISNNHHRGVDFFSKMERILQIFEIDIKTYFSNSDIFNIFKGNKRILLFLFKEKVIFMDKYIIKQLFSHKYAQYNYIQYFLPEIKSIQKINIPYFAQKFEIPADFNEKRKKGENDNYICQMIRNDSIDEFIIYVNKNNYSLQNKIKSQSIYEN